MSLTARLKAASNTYTSCFRSCGDSGRHTRKLRRCGWGWRMLDAKRPAAADGTSQQSEAAKRADYYTGTGICSRVANFSSAPTTPT